MKPNSLVKSHGSANVNAFAHAIADAAFQARQQLPEKYWLGLLVINDLIFIYYE